MPVRNYFVFRNSDITAKEVDTCLVLLKNHGVEALAVSEEDIDKKGVNEPETVLGTAVKPDDVFIALSDTSVLDLNHIFVNTEHQILSIELPGDHSFFSEIRQADLEWASKKLLDSQFETDTRTRLWVDKQNTALNDVVISPNKPGVRMRYDVFVNGESILDDPDLANQFIISTPTGSTSLSLNLGGCIMHPRVAAFQLLAVASRNYGNPAELISDESTITVEIIDSEFPPIYTFDNVRFITLAKNEEERFLVNIEKAPASCKFIHFVRDDKITRRKLQDKRKFEDVKSLTTTAKFILHVLEQNDRMSIQSIIRETNITNRKTISNALKLLIEKDFIKKQGSLSDARKQVYSLKR
ncbi:MAG: winged helix DNA-binding protein [Candidatus Odinarchaeota archaeon]